MMYNVNEYFESMQGEGFFTGTPSFFVRMQGCDVGCKFCDTKYTWSLKSKLVPHQNLKENSPNYAKMEVQEIIDLALKSPHTVITGGEPCLQNLTQLTDELIYSFKTVQVETSGTEPILVNANTWVTLSPKFNNPAKKITLISSIKRANEFKFPVARDSDIELIDDFFYYNSRENRIVWLQPISQCEKATKLCLDIARARKWRVSIQTHKFLGLR